MIWFGELFLELQLYRKDAKAQGNEKMVLVPSRLGG